MCFSAFHYYTARLLHARRRNIFWTFPWSREFLMLGYWCDIFPRVLYHLWNETPCTSFPSGCRSLESAYCRGVSVIYESLITPIKLEGGLTCMFYSNHGGTQKRKQSGEVFRRDVSPMISKSYVGLPDQNVRTLRRSLLWSLHGPESWESSSLHITRRDAPHESWDWRRCAKQGWRVTA